MTPKERAVMQQALEALVYLLALDDSRDFLIEVSEWEVPRDAIIALQNALSEEKNK